MKLLIFGHLELLLGIVWSPKDQVQWPSSHDMKVNMIHRLASILSSVDNYAITTLVNALRSCHFPCNYHAVTKENASCISPVFAIQHQPFSAITPSTVDHACF